MVDVRVDKYVSTDAHGKPAEYFVASAGGSSKRWRTVPELTQQFRGIYVTGLQAFGLNGPETRELYGGLKKDTNARS